MQPDPRPPDTGPERPYAPRAFGTGQDPAPPPGSFLPPEPDLPPREEPQDGRDQEGGQTRSRLPRIVAYVLIVLGVFFFLRYQVFSISNIRIIGIRNVSRETVIRALETIPGAVSLTPLGMLEAGTADFELVLPMGRDAREEVFRALAAAGLPLLYTYGGEASLEDIFLHLVGKETEATA